MALASGRFGLQPSAVFGVGIELTWRGEELARLHALTTQPTEAAAWERYLKADADKLSLDALMADARCPVHLIRGDRVEAHLLA